MRLTFSIELVTETIKYRARGETRKYRARSETRKQARKQPRTSLSKCASCLIHLFIRLLLRRDLDAPGFAVRRRHAGHRGRVRGDRVHDAGGAEVAGHRGLAHTYLQANTRRTRRVVANFWQNFGRISPVFGCIGADLCKSIRVLQHFSKSTKLSN